MNETYTAWKLNYEILWEDDSGWGGQNGSKKSSGHYGKAICDASSEFVIEDLDRLVRRTVISTVDDWRKNLIPHQQSSNRQSTGRGWARGTPGSISLSLPLMHIIVHTAARFVLADGVGLGKTLQLAMAAQLMALKGDKPVLILVPKTILWQWQDENANTPGCTKRSLEWKAMG